MKTCTKCKIEKSEEDFTKEEKRKDGLYTWCRECLSQHRRERYAKTPRKVWVEQKVCSKCKQWKPRDQYRLYANKNLHYRCIECEDKEETEKSSGLCECSECLEVKPLSEFYLSCIKKTSKQCKACHSKYHRSDDVRIRARDNSLRKFFGISLEDYKQQLEKQDYTCPICLKPFEKDKYSYPVDHAHSGPHQGRIRAILHDRCNRFVMFNHNDPEELRRAAHLIEHPLTDWFVPEEYVKSRKPKKKKIVK